MSRTICTLLYLSLAICLLLTPAISHAQYRASIQGVVTDPQGAVIPGAAITLQNVETGQLLKTNSDDKGIYNFNGLPPSNFSLTVEKDGFKKKTIERFGITAEQANAMNVQLDIGDAAQTVTVNGDAAPLLDTETANLGGEVRASEFQSLASFGRDPFQLLQLAPGAFGDGAQGAGGGTNNLPSSSMGGSGGTDGIFKIENGGQISANGARAGENNYQIDGVGTTSVTWGGSSVVTPNEDSIKEIKVVTDNYDAENGRYRGAQVQIISQNGTNNYHGSLFFKIHRPGLDAFTKYNGFNSDLPGCIDDKAHGYCGNVRDSNRFNDWGGTLGGPIIHNRLFGFFSYETISNNAAAAPQAGQWYETSALRSLAPSGSNSGKFFAFPGVGAFGGAQQDQRCNSVGLIEGTNCITIPGQGLNLGRPLAAALGTRDAGYQNSGNPGTGGDGKGGANNLDSTTADIAFIVGTNSPATQTHRQYNGRIDFNATNKDLLAASFYYVPNSTTGINGNGNRQMNTFNSIYHNRAATFIWDHTFGTSMANEVRANAAGWLEKDLDQNPNAPWGLPQIGFNPTGGFTLQGYGIGSFNGFDQWTYAAKDVLTKIHGAHTMKMGGEFTRLLSVDAPFWADRPGYTFNNIWDFLNDAPITESAQFDPKTGIPSALRKDLRDNIVGIFFQDNWKAKPNLTLTLGLRWEYFGAVSEKTGKLGTVVLGTGAQQFTNLRIRTGGTEFNPQKTNFAPQLGFAWSPRHLAGHDLSNRLVIRGGFGIAYNGVVQSNTLDTRFNPPFVDNSQSLCAPGPSCSASQQLTYIGTFPSNVHSPNGYAANPNAIVKFDSATNLPTNPTTGALQCCVDLTALTADWPTTYDYHYTLGGEYSLGRNWMASVGYQGSQTRHLTNHYNMYDPAAAAGIPLNPVVHGITQYADVGSAHFNALLLEAKHNFSDSFQLDTQYRLSHAVDTGSNAYAGPIYQWNLATALGTADYDVRHAFKLYGVWAPRIFRGSRSWMEKLAGGWSVSGILNAHSGFPWTPQYNWQGANDIGNGYDPVFNFGQFAGGSSGDAGSATYIPAAYKGGYHPNYRSNTTSTGGGSAFFTPPTIVPGTLFTCLFPNPPVAQCPSGQQGFGPLPTAPGMARNSLYGPGYFDIDATLSKSFGLPTMKVLGEGAKVEIRANFYNLFNKLNLNGNGNVWSNGVQSDIFNPNFGESASALGARVIEMQARLSF